MFHTRMRCLKQKYSPSVIINLKFSWMLFLEYIIAVVLNLTPEIHGQKTIRNSTEEPRESIPISKRQNKQRKKQQEKY